MQKEAGPVLDGPSLLHANAGVFLVVVVLIILQGVSKRRYLNQ